MTPLVREEKHQSYSPFGPSIKPSKLTATDNISFRIATSFKNDDNSLLNECSCTES